MMLKIMFGFGQVRCSIWSMAMLALVVSGLFAGGRAQGAAPAFTVHVDDYGAVGDGVANDAPAIASAIAALPSSGGIVKFGAKVYRITSTIHVNKKAYLKGEGRSENSGNGSGTEILKDGNFHGIIVEAPAVTIESLTVEGATHQDPITGEKIYDNSSNGIVVGKSQTNTSFVILRDVSVHNHGGNGIEMGSGDSTGTINHWRLDNIACHANLNTGLRIDWGDSQTSGPQANSGTAIKIHLFNNGGHGLYVANAGGNVFTGVTTEKNDAWGVYIGPYATKNTFVGGVFAENNVDGDFYTHEDSEFTTVLGTSIRNRITLNGHRDYILDQESLSGQVIKIDRKDYNEVNTGTGTIPLDDTKPQSNEGTQFMDIAVDRRISGSLFRVKVSAWVASSSVGNMQIALFKDAESNAIAAASQAYNIANDMLYLALDVEIEADPGTTVFKVRIGNNASSTTTFNGAAGNRLFDSIMNSSIVVEEIY